MNIQEAIFVLQSGFPYSDFHHYWSSVSSSDYMASPYLKYGLLAAATFEFFILWIKSSSFSQRESSQLHPVRIRFINHVIRRQYHTRTVESCPSEKKCNKKIVLISKVLFLHPRVMKSQLCSRVVYEVILNYT